MKTKTYWIGIFGVLFLLSGCHNPKILSTQIEKVSIAEMAIIKAQDSRASEFAPQELRNAQNKLQKAKEALQNKNYNEAALLAEQALVDAKLAEAKSEFEMVQNINDEI